MEARNPDAFFIPRDISILKLGTMRHGVVIVPNPVQLWILYGITYQAVVHQLARKCKHPFPVASVPDEWREECFGTPGTAYVGYEVMTLLSEMAARKDASCWLERDGLHIGDPSRTLKQRTTANQSLSSGDRGELFDRFYKELQHLSRHCKGQRVTREEACRDQFPNFSIWKRIDNSNVSENERKDFFRRIAQMNADEMFDLIGSLFSLSGHTAKTIWKRRRKDKRP